MSDARSKVLLRIKELNYDIAACDAAPMIVAGQIYMRVSRQWLQTRIQPSQNDVDQIIHAWFKALGSRAELPAPPPLRAELPAPPRRPELLLSKSPLKRPLGSPQAAPLPFKRSKIDDDERIKWFCPLDDSCFIQDYAKQVRMLIDASDSVTASKATSKRDEEDE